MSPLSKTWEEMYEEGFWYWKRFEAQLDSRGRERMEPMAFGKNPYYEAGEREAAQKKAEEEIGGASLHSPSAQGRAKALWELFRDLCDDDDTIIADAILGIIQEAEENLARGHDPVRSNWHLVSIVEEWCEKERPKWVEKRAEYLLKHGIPKRKEWSSE